MAELQPTSPPPSAAEPSSATPTQQVQPPPNPPVGTGDHLANLMQKGVDPAGKVAVQPAAHLANPLTLGETRVDPSITSETPSKK